MRQGLDIFRPSFDFFRPLLSLPEIPPGIESPRPSRRRRLSAFLKRAFHSPGGTGLILSPDHDSGGNTPNSGCVATTSASDCAALALSPDTAAHTLIPVSAAADSPATTHSSSPASASASAARPVRNTPTLDATAFPHILGSILAYADHPTLLSLRLLSRKTHEHIDAGLARHLVVHAQMIAPYGKKGWHPRLAPLFDARIAWLARRARISRAARRVNPSRLLTRCVSPEALDPTPPDLRMDPLTFFAQYTRVIDLKCAGTPAIGGVLLALLTAGTSSSATSGIFPTPAASASSVTLRVPQRAVYSGCALGLTHPPTYGRGRSGEGGPRHAVVSVRRATRVVLHVDVREAGMLALGRGVRVQHLVVVVHVREVGGVWGPDERAAWVHARAGEWARGCARALAAMQPRPGRVTIVCPDMGVLLRVREVLGAVGGRPATDGLPVLGRFSDSLNVDVDIGFRDLHAYRAEAGVDRFTLETEW